MFLDLDELPTLFDMHPLWSNQQVNLAYFRRRDHFGDPQIPIKQRFKTWLKNVWDGDPRGPSGC